jgi:hypothetical protein
MRPFHVRRTISCLRMHVTRESYGVSITCHVLVALYQVCIVRIEIFLYVCLLHLVVHTYLFVKSYRIALLLAYGTKSREKKY